MNSQLSMLVGVLIYVHYAHTAYAVLSHILQSALTVLTLVCNILIKEVSVALPHPQPGVLSSGTQNQIVLSLVWVCSSSW